MVVVAELEIGQAAIAIVEREIGLQPDRLGEVGDRIFIPSQMRERRATVV